MNLQDEMTVLYDEGYEFYMADECLFTPNKFHITQ